MARVKHYGRSMSKFDICYEIDRIHYSHMGLLYNTLSYDELRRKLYIVVHLYAPERIIEFTNLTY